MDEVRTLKSACGHDGCTTTIGARNKTGLCVVHYRQKIMHDGAKPKRTGSIYLVNAQVTWLHKSESGLDVVQVEKGPTSYAKQLARYIRDPSTIRARTMNEWGKSPSIETIKGFITQWQAERAAFKAEADSLGQHDSDEADFTVRPWADAVRFDRALRKEKQSAVPFVVTDFTPPAPRFGPMEITAGVAKLMKCTVDDIRGRNKARHYVKARQVVCAVLRERGLSFTQIGTWLNRDHSTIMHAIDAFDEKASDHMRWVVSQFVRQDIECEAA